MRRVFKGRPALWDLQRILPLLLVVQVALGVFFMAYMRQSRPALVQTDLLSINMRGVEVRAVASDTGGWNALSPVLRRALESGAVVRVHLSGASARALRSGGLSPDTRLKVTLSTESKGMPVGELWPQSTVSSFVGQPHDITIVGTSASKEGIVVAADALCTSAARQSLSLVEDMYRVSGGTLQSIVARCPERVAAVRACVPDSVSYKLMREREPGKAAVELGLQVRICGGPQFDGTARAAAKDGALELKREALRAKLGLRPDTLLVLAVGQVHGTSEMASLLLEGVMHAKAAGRLAKADAAILLRMHPRADPADKELAMQIKNDHPGYFTTALELGVAAMGSYVSSEDLLPAADVVVSGHSTVNYHAILWGIPGVVYLGTPTELEQMAQEKGLPVQPEVEVGAAWRAGTPEEFSAILGHLAQEDKSQMFRSLKAAQARFSAANDGNAADRAWRYTLNISPDR